MRKKYTFHLDLPLIEAIPKDVKAILSYLIDDCELPNELELPDADFFKNANWTNLFTDASIFAKFEGNRFFAFNALDNPEALVVLFLHWVSTYFVRDAQPRCVGWFMVRGDYPMIITLQDHKFHFLQVGDIYMQNEPTVLVDTRNSCAEVSPATSMDVRIISNPVSDNTKN